MRDQQQWTAVADAAEPTSAAAKTTASGSTTITNHNNDNESHQQQQRHQQQMQANVIYGVRVSRKQSTKSGGKNSNTKQKSIRTYEKKKQHRDE